MGGENNKNTSGTTTATGNVIQQQITRPPEYYLFIGFEVNHMDTAFENNTQSLDMANGGDYGHAFFYTTKDNIVDTFFSFGPSGAAAPNKAEAAIGIDRASGRRPGTTSYRISEVSRLFRFKITEKQAEDIKREADAFTAKVRSGEEKYTAYMNDTCAETAKDILDAAGIDTPNGQGFVRSGNDTADFWFGPLEVKGQRVPFSGTYFVTPYSWYTQMEEKYGSPFLYTHTGLKPDGIYLKEPWILVSGQSSQLYATQHGNLSTKK